MPLDAWVEGVRSGLSGFEATQHLSGNHRIEVDGPGAHATSNIQASHMLDGQRVTLGGWYDTHLTRGDDDGWRIGRSQLNITWREGDEGLFALARARHDAA